MKSKAYISKSARVMGFLFTAALLSACAGTGYGEGYGDKAEPSKSAKTETSNTETSKTEISKTEQQPTYQAVTNPHFAEIAKLSDKPGKDRAAVLAMQGEYKVGFHFEETVVLEEGYERHPAKDSGGYEAVVVVKDTPEHIVLQHILVMHGHVIKHWRQDWFYQATERFEFVADQTWAIKPIPAEKQSGFWTQCVYEVSDAPRYCGTGKWNHKYGVSTWTSDRTWRPLPRREYTKRDDYNALNVENRHTITPDGWTHEQDNTKTLRNGSKTEKTLVREFGFNDYRNIEGYDFTPGYDYWKRTADYWAMVRATWSQHFDQNRQVALKTKVDGMPIITATFGHAEKIDKQEPEANSIGQAEVDEVFEQWVSAKLD